MCKKLSMRAEQGPQFTQRRISKLPQVWSGFQQGQDTCPVFSKFFRRQLPQSLCGVADGDPFVVELEDDDKVIPPALRPVRDRRELNFTQGILRCTHAARIESNRLGGFYQSRKVRTVTICSRRLPQYANRLFFAVEGGHHGQTCGPAVVCDVLMDNRISHASESARRGPSLSGAGRRCVRSGRGGGRSSPSRFRYDRCSSATFQVTPPSVLKSARSLLEIPAATSFRSPDSKSWVILIHVP